MTEQDRNQTLALAAIFQAALLADKVASSGELDAAMATPLLDSVLVLDADAASEIYPDAASLRPGLSLLRDALQGGQRPNNMRPVSHALSLIQLATFLRRNNELTQILRHRLEALRSQENSTLAGQSVDDRAQRYAGVYLDTLGTMKFRIRVQGDPRHLQNESLASNIRALFLAGVRAAFLWHAAGGRRWQLLFSRRRLLNATTELLKSI